MQIRMTGVPITDKCLVMAAASAKRTGPAGVAIVLTVDVAAIQEVRLLGSIETSRDIAQRVRVRIDKPVTRRQVARGTYAHQTQRRATRMRLIHALI